jgi:hypothetical protein
MGKSNAIRVTVAIKKEDHPTKEDAQIAAEDKAMDDIYLSEDAHVFSIRDAGDFWEVSVLVDRKDVR